MLCHTAVRIDLQDPLRSHVHLGASDGTFQSDDLPVQICNIHHILITEIQGSHSRAGESLHHITSHAAYAKYGDTAARQALHGVFSQEPPGSYESVILLYIHCTLPRSVQYPSSLPVVLRSASPLSSWAAAVLRSPLRAS